MEQAVWLIFPINHTAPQTRSVPCLHGEGLQADLEVPPLVYPTPEEGNQPDQFDHAYRPDCHQLRHRMPKADVVVGRILFGPRDFTRGLAWL
jgi:hypothetical protein